MQTRGKWSAMAFVAVMLTAFWLPRVCLCQAGVETFDGKTAAQWSAALKSPEVKTRQVAAKSLRGIGVAAKEAVPALTAALKDSDIEVRLTAAGALGRMGPAAAAAVPALAAAMKDPEPKVRHRAADTLKDMRGAAREAVPALIEAMKANDGWTHRKAAMALVEIAPDAGAVEAIPAFIEMIAYEYKGKPDRNEWTGRDSDMVEHAFQGLGRFGPRASTAVPVAVEVMTDKKRYIPHRSAAVWCLGQIGPAAKDALPALQAAAQEPMAPLLRALAAEAMRKITGEPKGASHE